MENKNSTRTFTTLSSGERISKASLRIKALGAIEELSSWLGFATAASRDPTLNGILIAIQKDLFLIGVRLTRGSAAPTSADVPPLSSEEEITAQIRRFTGTLEPLHQIVLPGGTELAARLHICRCVTRRAESCLVELHEQSPLAASLLNYIDRLSQWLFNLARFANKREGIEACSRQVAPSGP